MSFNSEIIVFTTFVIIFLASIIFGQITKKKKSAKTIYKMINELEKKYIY